MSAKCRWSAALPGAPDGNLIRITQSKDHVAIVQEKFHDPRIVSLDGRAHLPPQIRSWVGDSIGRWMTTPGDRHHNFTDKLVLSRRFDGNLHLVERFTRVGPNTLLYEFTVEDPTFFTKPWTVRLPMTKTDDELYEYACHEGNYALPKFCEGLELQSRTNARRISRPQAPAALQSTRFKAPVTYVGLGLLGDTLAFHRGGPSRQAGFRTTLSRACRARGCTKVNRV